MKNKKKRVERRKHIKIMQKSKSFLVKEIYEKMAPKY
jgi:hypothetical protein